MLRNRAFLELLKGMEMKYIYDDSKRNGVLSEKLEVNSLYLIELFTYYRIDGVDYDFVYTSFFTVPSQPNNRGIITSIECFDGIYEENNGYFYMVDLIIEPDYLNIYFTYNTNHIDFTRFKISKIR